MKSSVADDEPRSVEVAPELLPVVEALAEFLLEDLRDEKNDDDERRAA